MASDWVKMFNDPITMEPMKDPVVASDGHTYDFTSLVKWMERDPFRRSPITKEVLRAQVYVNGQMLNFLETKSPGPQCRRIYSSIKCREMSLPLDGLAAHCPWIVRFLTKIGWRRRNLTLVVPVTRVDGAWEAVGPPIAHPWEDALKDWVKDFGLENIVTNPKCLSFAKIFVDGRMQGTLEEICGSDVASECR